MDLSGLKDFANQPSAVASTPSVLQGGFASRETQALRTQTINYSFDIETADGRSASIELDFASLDYQRTYTAAGALVGQGSGDFGRIPTAASFLQQSAVYEQQSINIQEIDLEISGDLELLEEYFGSENTAQRIFDHVSGLLGGLGVDDAGFQESVAQITQGVQQGFDQAQAILGAPLPSVSQDTQTLLEAMLEDLQVNGPQNQQAANFLALLTTEELHSASSLTSGIAELHSAMIKRFTSQISMMR